MSKGRIRNALIKCIRCAEEVSSNLLSKALPVMIREPHVEISCNIYILSDIRRFTVAAKA